MYKHHEQAQPYPAQPEFWNGRQLMPEETGAFKRPIELNEEETAAVDACVAELLERSALQPDAPYVGYHRAVDIAMRAAYEAAELMKQRMTGEQ